MNINECPRTLPRHRLQARHADDTFDVLFGPWDRPLGLARVGTIHYGALGPGRRKNSTHFELRDERTVVSWLRVQAFALFTPRADAVLASIKEGSELDIPLGQHLSVYAMLQSDQLVPLVRLDTDDGRRLLDGAIPLPYHEADVDLLAAITIPIERVRAAVDVDVQATFDFIAATRA